MKQSKININYKDVQKQQFIVSKYITNSANKMAAEHLNSLCKISVFIGVPYSRDEKLNPIM